LSLLQSLDARADFLDHADTFVTEHEARLDRECAVIEVQIGSADSGASDSHERVGRRLESGIGDPFNANVVRSVENSSLHERVLFIEVRKYDARILAQTGPRLQRRRSAC